MSGANRGITMRRLSFSTKFLSLGSLLGLVFGLIPTPELSGQMINVGTPFNSVSDSFYERNGVNFGFSIPGGRGNGSRIVGLNPQGMITPNINFNQNGFGSAVPAFGGYDPGASARTGFGVFNRNGGGFSLGFELGKGSNRSITSTVPSVTVPNGFGGSVQSGAFRPFVTGVIPVVSSGNTFLPRATPVQPAPYNGVTQAMQSGQLRLGGPVEPAPVKPGPVNYAPERSSAESSDISVAEIKARRAAAIRAKQERLEYLIQSISELEAERDFVQARANIWEAIRMTDDKALKANLREQLKAMRGK